MQGSANSQATRSTCKYTLATTTYYLYNPSTWSTHVALMVSASEGRQAADGYRLGTHTHTHTLQHPAIHKDTRSVSMRSFISTPGSSSSCSCSSLLGLRLLLLLGTICSCRAWLLLRLLLHELLPVDWLLHCCWPYGFIWWE